MDQTAMKGLRHLRLLGRTVTWVLVAMCAVWTVVRISGWIPPWPASAALAFTPWIMAVAVLVVVVSGLTRNWLAIHVAVATLIALGIVVMPRAWGSGEHRPGAGLRVMTLNMRVGGADPATITRLVRDNKVDLLALQEFTPRASARLAAAGLDTLLPYQVRDAEPLAIGSALYSAYRLTGGTTRVGPGGFVQADATLAVPGAVPLAVRSVHPCAPFTAAHQGCWVEGMGGEPRATTNGRYRLLLGDFNSTLDHPPLRGLIDSGYRDAASVVGAGLHPTWPADPMPAITLDHILADQRIGVRTVSVHQIPATDHRALAATLILPGAH